MSQPFYKRGDIVLFRHYVPIDEFQVKRGPLLIGIIRSIDPYITTSRDQVTYQWRYQIHVAGKCIPRETYHDRVATIDITLKTHDQSSSQNPRTPTQKIHLPMALKARSREMFAGNLRQMKVNERNCGHHFDSGADMYDQISDLKEIVLNARNIHAKSTPYACTQINTMEENIIRPSAFYEHVRMIISAFASKRSIVIQRLWFRKFKVRIQDINHRRNMASVLIQKYWRRHLQHDTIDTKRKRRDWMKVHGRFLSFYTTNNNASIGTSTPIENIPKTLKASSEYPCSYNVKGPSNVFLTTQAMADEWADVMRSSVDKISVLAKPSIISRMTEALRRWAHAIELQNQELKIMYDEEIYCMI